MKDNRRFISFWSVKPLWLPLAGRNCALKPNLTRRLPSFNARPETRSAPTILSQSCDKLPRRFFRKRSNIAKRRLTPILFNFCGCDNFTRRF
jgi:hypothetical protein